MANCGRVVDVSFGVASYHVIVCEDILSCFLSVSIPFDASIHSFYTSRRGAPSQGKEKRKLVKRLMELKIVSMTTLRGFTFLSAKVVLSILKRFCHCFVVKPGEEELVDIRRCRTSTHSVYLVFLLLWIVQTAEIPDYRGSNP